MGASGAFEKQIFEEKLHALYSTNWMSTIAHLLVGLVYLLMQFSYHNPVQLLRWYVSLGVVFVCRAVLTLAFYRRRRGSHNLARWLNSYRLGSLAVGLVFGSTMVFFYPTDDVPRQMFTILVLAGLASSGLTVLASDQICYSGYCLALVSPIILLSFLAGSQFYIAVGILLTIFLVIYIRASGKLDDIVSSSMQLGYENSSLVSSLNQEKKLLSSRLARIFQDSSNELYIVDTNSLVFQQVNKGALDNLGYSEDEITKYSILDVIVDLDIDALNTLLVPLRLGQKESVFYKTLQRRKDGSTYPVELRFQLSMQENPPVLVVTALDISERDEAERKLIHQANFDQLTALPNRYYMLSHVSSALARARREQKKVALLYMDLDNFKTINDTLGHNIGDELLKQVAGRIRSLLREVDTPARLGGDEFLIMLEGLQSHEQVEGVVHKISGFLELPFYLENHEVYTSASIGISIYPDDGHSVELLMQYADTAMYSAKQDSKRSYRFFSKELRTHIDEQLAIETRLRHALENHELSLHYQPKINIQTEQVVGAEALLRWHNSDLGTVPPNVFIPIAEKYGLFEGIGAWILQTACRQAKEWYDQDGTWLRVAVNISPRQFRSSSFVEDVKQALRRSGMPSEYLELEVTEGILMQNIIEPQQIMQALVDNNITLALDNFGTGYSSLSNLKQFPLRVVKIDRSFINDMMENDYNLSLVDAIISMAKILGLQLVAEGVETVGQLDFLKDKSVEVVQGYLFSPPLSAEEFKQYCKRSLEQGGVNHLLSN